MQAKRAVLGLFLLLVTVQSAFAQAGSQSPVKTSNSSAELDGAWKLASLSFTRLMTP